MLLHYDEALKYVVSIQDKTTRALVSVAFRGLELAIQQGEQLEGDLDLLFIVKGLEVSLKKHDSIRLILSGEDLLWPE